MRSSAQLWTVCALALGSAAHVGAGRAVAQACETDDDCAAGLICKNYGAEVCATPAIDCAEGQECPEPEPCEPVEVKACALPPCESDDDCPSGTVCHAFTYQQCTDGGSAEPAPACADGEECPQPEQPVCEDPECKEEIEATCEEMTQEAACTPVWQLPCAQSADCGPGFTCVERVNEWCRGSSGGATPSDGSEPVPPEGDPLPEPEPAPEPECGSEPTGEFYCKITVTECSSDDDCEDGWSCTDNPERAVCGGSSSEPAIPDDSDSGGSGDFAPPPEEEPVDDGCPESTDPEKVCMPPYHDVGGGVGRDASGTGGLADGEGAPTQSTGGEGDDDDGDAESESDSGSAESDSGGCSIAAGEGTRGSAVTLLGLLGVCALLRRRARKA